MALKLVRPERLNVHALDLFSREARAGGRPSHPGTVSLFGHGETEGVASSPCPREESRAGSMTAEEDAGPHPP